MARGLGQQQKTILKTVAGMESGGGTKEEVYYRIKEALHPDMKFRVDASKIYNPDNVVEYTMRDGSTHKSKVMGYEVARQNEEYLLRNFRREPGTSEKLARIRVSVCTSVRALIKRGYIEETKEKWRFILTITDKGREAINPNAEENTRV